DAQAPLGAETRARAHRVLDFVMRNNENLAAALAHSQQAALAAQQANLPALALRCRVDAVRLLFMQGRFAHVLMQSEEIMPQLAEIGDSYGRGVLHSSMALSYLLLGELQAGLAAAEAGYGVRVEIGDVPGRIIAANHRALLLMTLDRVAEARAVIEDALAIRTLTDEMHELGYTLDKLAKIQLLEGDAAAAQATLRRALALPAAANDVRLAGYLRRSLALALLTMGARAAARQVLAEDLITSELRFVFEHQLLEGLIALADGDTLAAQTIGARLALWARTEGYYLLAKKADQLVARVEAPLHPAGWARLLWVGA
ncbi:MAG: hypothetical protein H7Y32_02335, partial [Chloroflexales bacterium]|nr:hypothetical protein [Chloroflexales bacterium]